MNTMQIDTVALFEVCAKLTLLLSVLGLKVEQKKSDV